MKLFAAQCMLSIGCAIEVSVLEDPENVYF